MFSYVFFWIAVIIILTSIVFMSWKNGITPTPTSLRAKRRLEQHLQVIKPGKIYELGSGFGTMALSLARKYPQYKIIACENSLFPYLTAKFLNIFFRYNNLLIVRADLFELQLNDAALVYCYLYPQAMQKLKIKFEKELPKGCVVISNTFAIPTWAPQAVVQVQDLYKTKIYFYRV